MEASTLRRRSAAQSSSDRALNLDSLRQLQESAAPLFVYLATFLEEVTPVIDFVKTNGQQLWTALQPYHPEDLFPAIYGLFLVFFGGVYMTIVASAEAAYQFGWDRIKVSLIALHGEWHKASDAFQRDNKIDKDRDGVADVEEMSAKDLAARRLMVLTRAMDPEKVSAALEGLTIAVVAILATLRVKFAKAITLGTAIGQVLEQILSPFTTPSLQYALPDDYDKWVPVISRYGFRYLGISMSWILMRVITAVFAALKGSELSLLGIIGYLENFGYVERGTFKKGNPAVVGAWALLAMVGAYLQISSGFTLPFPINLLFFPLTVLEQFIIFAVGTSAK